MAGKSYAGCVTCVVVAIVVLILVVGLPLAIVFRRHDAEDPDFSITDVSIRAFNISSDDKLLMISNIVIRVYNPDSKYTQRFSRLEVSVRKGKHHPIADDVVWGFRQERLNHTHLRAEAAAVYKQLERKIAAELRDDQAKGAGSVNIYLSGRIRKKKLTVTCKKVVVQLSKSTNKLSPVDCDVEAYNPAQQ